MNKEYFMTRLANGENIDDIGVEIAAMMNAAVAEHSAKLAATQEKESAKRELIEELVGIIQELAILEGIEADDFTLSNEEIDQLVEAFTEMFAAVRELKALVKKVDVKPTKVSRITSKSDDEVLADFIKMFS